MQTETITYLKEHANTLELQEELLITKNGKPAFVVQSYQGRSTIPGYADYLDRLARVPIPHKVALEQGGEWQEPAALRSDPGFRGHVVFLVNPEH